MSKKGVKMTQMIKAQELLPLPDIPEVWDCEKSVEKVKKMVYQWKNLTAEIAVDLFIAREKLSSQGLRTDIGTNVPKLTWAAYCESIGLEKRTANRWLATIFGNVRLPSPLLPKLESQVIYADPPWEFMNSGFDQSAAQIYPTMSVEKICA